MFYIYIYKLSMCIDSIPKEEKTVWKPIFYGYKWDNEFDINWTNCYWSYYLDWLRFEFNVEWVGSVRSALQIPEGKRVPFIKIGYIK